MSYLNTCYKRCSLPTSSEILTDDRLKDHLDASQLVKWIDCDLGQYVVHINHFGHCHTNVKHLPSCHNQTTDIHPMQLNELAWEELSKLPLLTTNVFIVTWHEADIDTNCSINEPLAYNCSDSHYESFQSDSKQTLLTAGLMVMDPLTRTFCVSNSLNTLGQGNSGATIVGHVNGVAYRFGEVSGIVDGKNGRHDLLRCERSDSQNMELFQHDIACMLKRKKRKKVRQAPPIPDHKDIFISSIASDTITKNRLSIQTPIQETNPNQNSVYLEYTPLPNRLPLTHNKTKIIVDLVHNSKHCIHCRNFLKGLIRDDHISVQEIVHSTTHVSIDLNRWLTILDTIFHDYDNTTGRGHIFLKKERIEYQLESSGWQTAEPHAIVIKGLTFPLSKS